MDVFSKLKLIGGQRCEDEGANVSKIGSEVFCIWVQYVDCEYGKIRIEKVDCSQQYINIRNSHVHYHSRCEPSSLYMPLIDAVCVCSW